MIYNWKLGQYDEDLEFELNNTGSTAFTLRFDGVLDFAFSNVTLYSDENRTTPLSAADWQYTTQDLDYTALEAESGGSGQTIYTEIQVVNTDYQDVILYGTCNNFGAYTNGKALSTRIYQVNSSTVVSDAYSFEIDPQVLKSILVIDSTITSQLTITLTQGTHPSGNASVQNIVEIRNNSGLSDNYHIVTDGTENWWLSENQTTEYFFNESDELYRGKGWELIYNAPSNTSNVDLSSLNKDFITWTEYAIRVNIASDGYQTSGIIMDDAVNSFSVGAGVAATLNTSTLIGATSSASAYIISIWRKYE